MLFKGYKVLLCSCTPHGAKFIPITQLLRKLLWTRCSIYCCKTKTEPWAEEKRCGFCRSESIYQNQTCPLVARLLSFPVLAGNWHTACWRNKCCYKMLQNYNFEGVRAAGFRVKPRNTHLNQKFLRIKLIFVFIPNVFLSFSSSLLQRMFLIFKAASSVFTFECPAWACTHPTLFSHSPSLLLLSPLLPSLALPPPLPTVSFFTSDTALPLAGGHTQALTILTGILHDFLLILLHLQLPLSLSSSPWIKLLKRKP